MLNILRLTNKELKDGTAMLLGGFDGLHLGHRQLLSRAKESGLPVGIMTILGGKDESVFTLAERAEIFRRVGLDFAVAFSFSEIKELSPAEFLTILEKEFSPKLYVCGDDFRFGKNAQGTTETLRQSVATRVIVENLLLENGEKISTRTVKKRLSEGEVEKANALLCEEFFLLGEVYRDRGVGKTLNFPTANIRYPKDKFPIKKGVYETCVTVDGNGYKGITNFGARPTFDDGTVVTETHLDGFSGDLYGKTLKITFKRFLRETIKFTDAEALRKQLQTDIRRVREND